MDVLEDKKAECLQETQINTFKDYQKTEFKTEYKREMN